MLTSGALVRADVTGSILGVVHDRSQAVVAGARIVATNVRSEEHTSELQSRLHLVFRLLLEKKNSEGKYLVAQSFVIVSSLTLTSTPIHTLHINYMHTLRFLLVSSILIDTIKS